MAHETFEDRGVAEFLNKNFVSIKVDREERPDIDTVYMKATTTLTGQGGWPMTLFLDSDARPFYAGTYFPPRPAHGRPSFGQLIEAIDSGWRDNRKEILDSATNIHSSLNAKNGTDLTQESEVITNQHLSRAVRELGRLFDPDNGGFGNAPKFPPSMILQFLLNEYDRVGNTTALSIAEKTLTSMARGGIYDQLGGGFARYSVDAKWVVPHFEKMLYDNALLLRVYMSWWKLTGSPLAQRVVSETAEFLLRELRTPEGGFASAIDADSEGAEGVFYIWNPAAIHDLLGSEDGDFACALLNVTPVGTFEDGYSTLQLQSDPDDNLRWMRIKRSLYEARNLRPHPHLDDKIVASWNGLAISALSEAGMLFKEPIWIAAAEASASMLIDIHLGHHGSYRINRTSRNGIPGSNWGVLDDYANMAEGLLSLIQVTGNQYWFEIAGNLLEIATTNFSNDSQGFFYTDVNAPSLIQRPTNTYDNAEPSASFALAKALVTHSALSGESEYRDLAEASLAKVLDLDRISPMGLGWGLVAAQSLLSGPVQVAVVGTSDDGARNELLDAAWKLSASNSVIAFGESETGSAIGLMKNRTMLSSKPTAYLCRQFVCDQPTTELEIFKEQLRVR